MAKQDCDIDYDYVDWISNISGRLLFRLTNPFNYRLDRIVGDVIHFNHRFSCNKKRYIIVSMLIDTKDQKINTEHRYFTRVIFLANTEDQVGIDRKYKKNLRGDIFLFTPKNKSPDIIEETKLIKSINDAINNTSLEYQKEEQEKKSIEKIEKLNKIICKFASNTANTAADSKIYHSNICIKDTGFTYFKINISSNGKEEILTQQAFYFIKYLFHKHVFHMVTQENITKIQPKHNDEFCFAQKIISYLKHHISEVRNKKSDNAKYLQNLLGVVSYTNSLLDSLRREKMIDLSKPKEKEYYELEKNYLLNIKSSLENALKIHPYKSSSIIDFKDDIFSSSVIVIAITTPYFLINANNNTTKSLDSSYLHIYGIAFGIILVLTFTMSLLIHTRRENYLARIFSKILQKIFIVIKGKNNPTIKNNLASKICSKIVSIEMEIRRYPFKEKLILPIIIFIISASLSIFIFMKLISYI